MATSSEILLHGQYLPHCYGIYNGRPGAPGAEVIRSVDPDDDLSQYISTEKSGCGRGGMLTKCGIARKLADEGVEVIIANGKRDNILIDLIEHLFL